MATRVLAAGFVWRPASSPFCATQHDPTETAWQEHKRNGNIRSHSPDPFHRDADETLHALANESLRCEDGPRAYLKFLGLPNENTVEHPSAILARYGPLARFGRLFSTHNDEDEEQHVLFKTALCKTAQVAPLPPNKRSRAAAAQQPLKRPRPRLGHPFLDRRVRVLWESKNEESWYEGVVVEHMNWHLEEEALLRIRYDDGEVRASKISDIEVVENA